jgi:hypothetical protein
MGDFCRHSHKIDQDAIIMDHLDTSLMEAISQLIDPLAMTRAARAALEQVLVPAPA